MLAYIVANPSPTKYSKFLIDPNTPSPIFIPSYGSAMYALIGTSLCLQNYPNVITAAVEVKLNIAHSRTVYNFIKSEL